MKRAIIVEDSLLLSVIYKHYLKSLEIEVLAEVPKGETAIALLKDQEVDLIIMDIMLEGEMDGIQAMKEIRKFTPTPVIFASSNSDRPHKSRAAKILNSIFLTKPVAEEDFVNAVRKAKEMQNIE